MARGRIFEVVSKTAMLTEHQIQLALTHKVVRRWAYINHDKDVYSLKDEQQSRTRAAKAQAEGKPVPPIVTAGQPKDPHWHVVFETPFSATDTAAVAKWFGVPENFVEIKKGRGALLDSVQYITHEDDKQQAQGKHLYQDSEITASHGFDWRAELVEREKQLLKYGRELGPKERMRDDVLRRGKTLLQCLEEDPILYAQDFPTLKRLRLDYISRMPPPRTRINYYVEGRGGVGKGLFSRGLARTLAAAYCPELAGAEDDAVFFEIGAEGAAFEGYDGQPVIIWNDWRAFDLLKALKGRGNVFTVFDTHPTRQRQNIKYGSVNLCNVVNIVNSVQPFREFLDGLAGEYADKDGHKRGVEDKGQSYRRFPIIIPIHEEDFDILLNRGFMDGTSNFLEYVQYGSIRANMQRIAERCGRNEALARELEGQVMLPVLEGHKELEAVMDSEGTDEDAIRAEFADYGQRVPPGESNNKAVNAVRQQMYRERRAAARGKGKAKKPATSAAQAADPSPVLEQVDLAELEARADEAAAAAAAAEDGEQGAAV